MSVALRPATAIPPHTPTTTGPRSRALSDTSDEQRRRSRPRTCYQLARPAGHGRCRRLLLQIQQVQQVSDCPRPIPLFDIVRSPSLSRNWFSRRRHRRRQGLSSPEPPLLLLVAPDQQEPIASIAANSIVLAAGLICQASVANGTYEFLLHKHHPEHEHEHDQDHDNQQKDCLQTIVRWVLRPGMDQERRFTFSVIDPATRRHPVLASLTLSQLDIYDRPAQPGEAIVGDQLRTLMLATGVWVAFREGWLNLHFEGCST
ncbi:hypothetical protein ASPZODRAFT_133804 [Penicilliopsis zonata CBS 506.65]|uniref:Uncharacterized protein n=1 Tax=Penicilliopsis zonata CBS 506.65 TaxID=1073090 RepID=A0A1L9SFP9_9EURO|nr:hypothetical protein ASPZODRAFT_133804 [Penicilliopsis zonata CBS 506.65]OJJ45938.1 hypothetical protein ASPZODRAFT_133804 [Penicilliopsis zonata CBS 506.65]